MLNNSILFLTGNALPRPLLLHGSTSTICPTPLRRFSLFASSTFEPSFPFPSPQALPNPLLSTTIYYNIPSQPQHFIIENEKEAFPLAHPYDGDGYILAVSFPENVGAETWIRGRFVRTKPFFIESRQKKRIYRGLYGTPGAVGVNAPVKPKSSSAKGIMVWTTSNNQPRVVSFGQRALPLAMSIDTLVTRGPTAFGNMLTGSDELANERATELSLPPFILGDNLLVTVGVSRSPSGRIIGAVLCECNTEYQVTKRYNMATVPRGCDVVGLTACEQFIVVSMHRIKEGSGGILSAVFGTGKKKESPIVENKYGTCLCIVSRQSGQISNCIVPNILLTHLTNVEFTKPTSMDSELLLDAVELSHKKNEANIRLISIADSKTGVLWSEYSSHNQDNFLSSALRIKLNIGDDTNKNKMNVNFINKEYCMNVKKGTMFLDFLSLSQRNLLFAVFDSDTNRKGLIVSDKSNQTILESWFHDMDCMLSGMVLSPCGEYFSVLKTSKDDNSTNLLIFELGKISKGPVESIELATEKFGEICSSVGAVWANHASFWSKEGGKPVKSSYEIFDARDWNDIDSGFSSLGL